MIKYIILGFLYVQIGTGTTWHIEKSKGTKLDPISTLAVIILWPEVVTYLILQGK